MYIHCIVCAYAMVVHLSTKSVFVLVVSVVVRFVYPLVCSGGVSCVHRRGVDCVFFVDQNILVLIQ